MEGRRRRERGRPTIVASPCDAPSSSTRLPRTRPGSRTRRSQRESAEGHRKNSPPRPALSGCSRTVSEPPGMRNSRLYAGGESCVEEKDNQRGSLAREVFQVTVFAAALLLHPLLEWGGLAVTLASNTPKNLRASIPSSSSLDWKPPGWSLSILSSTIASWAKILSVNRFPPSLTSEWPRSHLQEDVSSSHSRKGWPVRPHPGGVRPSAVGCLQRQFWCNSAAIVRRHEGHFTMPRGRLYSSLPLVAVFLRCPPPPRPPQGIPCHDGREPLTPRRPQGQAIHPRGRQGWGRKDQHQVRPARSPCLPLSLKPIVASPDISPWLTTPLLPTVTSPISSHPPTPPYLSLSPTPPHLPPPPSPQP